MNQPNAQTNAWGLIETERRRDRLIRRLCVGAWTGTFIIMVLFAIVTVAPVLQMFRGAASGDRDLMLSLHLALLNRGIFARAAGGFFLSTPMTEAEIDHVAAQFSDALDEVKAR